MGGRERSLEQQRPGVSERFARAHLETPMRQGEALDEYFAAQEESPAGRPGSVSETLKGNEHDNCIQPLL